MVTLQEYLNSQYPTQEQRSKIKKIIVNPCFDGENIHHEWEWGKTNWKTSEFFWEAFLIPGMGNRKIVEGTIDLSDFSSVKEIELNDFILTSVDFLNTLPNPEKLEKLSLYNNNIQPTDISIFSRFINLICLKIGTTAWGINKGRNRFYGSLKAYQPLTKLSTICIEATDVNEGLEYLPFSLAQSTAETKDFREKNGFDRYKLVEGGGYNSIECSPHNTNAKCSQIQNELRPFDYDLGAWLLAHPQKVYQARPEVFQQPNDRWLWMKATKDKIEATRKKIEEVEASSKKMKRLKSKIRELSLIKTLMEERTIFEDSLKAGVRRYDKHKEDKSTQTENTSNSVGIQVKGLIENKTTQTKSVKTQNQQTQTEERIKYPMPGSWPNKKS